LYFSDGGFVATKQFIVKQDDNKGNNEFEITGKAVEIAIMVFRWNGNVKEKVDSKITVKRLTNCVNEQIEETLYNDISSETIVRDYDIFEHTYKIIVEEANAEIDIEIHYIQPFGF